VTSSGGSQGLGSEAAGLYVMRGVFVVSVFWIKKTRYHLSLICWLLESLFLVFLNPPRRFAGNREATKKNDETGGGDEEGLALTCDILSFFYFLPQRGVQHCWTCCETFFWVFLNSPCRDQAEIRSKMQENLRGWLVPRELIKYTSYVEVSDFVFRALDFGATYRFR
jgi:hypothetical protein